MALNDTILRVTERIESRSATLRADYMARCERAAEAGVRRAHLTCGNQAHAFAASGEDQAPLVEGTGGNLGIVTSYNDMLSAHQPFERFPDLIRKAARTACGTAQVAGGVPAMCDGVTQGQPGMELSLFSRDLIAMSAGVALSHNVFDSVVYLGVCDKIIPGLVIAAATFGHLPAVFLPAGPMTSGLPNDEKARVRQEFAEGKLSRKELMAAEIASYHGPGTCTFYGTANTNQMLMEFMGLHLPGASFINPNTPLRDALTIEGTKRALAISNLGNEYTPVSEILNAKSFVNGIVGLNATGGSTNLLIHLLAMGRAAGIVLDWEDISDISDAVPLIARVYPNGLADVNHFHAAGGLGYMIGELLSTGMLHPDTKTVVGEGLEAYTKEPKLRDGEVVYEGGARVSENDKILKTVADPFQKTGGIKRLKGNLGNAVMKTSAVDAARHIIEAPAKVFHDQEAVKTAFKDGSLNGDTVVVVRFQGPKANGMPELHSLSPLLGILQGRGYKIALVTDGRMSGASGKVPSAIHVSPEAVDGGVIAKLQDGDIVRVDAVAGTLDVLDEAVLAREAVVVDLSANSHGTGREMFEVFRKFVGSAETGASVI
ncbi:MAG: phosphogluconate dehydratase [Rhodobacteraceae bacterium]|nr:phosphogluconate dehydratase [Paracoccaceae bacterium]